MQDLFSDLKPACGERLRPPETEPQVSDLGQPEELAALLEQELSHCGVFCQADRPVVSVRGISSFSKLVHEVGSNCPVRLIIRHSVRVNGVQNGESRFGSVRFRNRGGVSSSRAERWRYPEQLFVEQHDGRPVDSSGARALGMCGLNGSFELKPADVALLESLGQMTFCFFY